MDQLFNGQLPFIPKRVKRRRAIQKTLDQTASCARRMDRDVFCVNAHGIKKEDILLIGVANNQHVVINPPSHTIIQSTDELIVLAQ